MADVLPITDHKDDSGFMGEINPSFSFPMSPPAPPSNSQSAVQIPPRRPADISIFPAPAFTFPSVPSTPPFQDSASSSPSRPRHAGHRRGPSEFIGGDGKSGSGLMSTSPTKGENALPNPTASGRRRGHAHRRSAAISHHDLSNIVNRPENSYRQAGSAPATPSEPGSEFARPTLDRARSQPSLPYGSPDLSDRPESPIENSSPSATTRPRVGFSDKLEYIPRPLSVISSATSSSVSTIRPEHSLNNSITSLRSLGISSSPSSKKDLESDDIFGGELHSDSFDDSPIRNGEARFGNGNGNGNGNSRTRHSSPPPPTFEDFSSEDVEESKVDSPIQAVPQLQADLSRLRGVPEPRPHSSPSESMENKRSKRGKSWSGLLSRKSKADSPPVEVSNPAHNEKIVSEFSLDDVNFDEDSTYVVRSPEYDVPRPISANPSPSAPVFDTDTDIGGAVLDLDEAWYRAGMNTSSSENARPRQAKRAMHSSGATGGFTAPGMHYHRRAESAPVMPPVDYALGFPRYGSNPQMQMADVFEEEEDDYNQNSLSRQVSRQNKIAKEKVVDALGVNVEEAEPQITKSPNDPVVDTAITPTLETSRETSTMLSSQPSDRSLKKFKDLNNQQAAPDVVRSSLFVTSAIDPSFSAQSQPNSIRNYASSHISYPSQSDRVSNFYGSNEASPLQTSFEVPRLGTAHSTGTDRSAWSSARTGENINSTSISMDDVPSLVSSSSTMISHIPHTPIIGSRLPGERAQSLTSEAFIRPRTPLQAAKRASLASLSKLMGGSFSEKSKLSIESKADYEDEEGSPKTKKRHRISRLMKMKFWKSKEDIRSLASRDGLKSA